jgi:hypothetical protein
VVKKTKQMEQITMEFSEGQTYQNSPRQVFLDVLLQKALFSQGMAVPWALLPLKTTRWVKMQRWKAAILISLTL